MEMREALDQISEIRERMESAAVFRGYRAVPVAFSAALAVAGALAQTAIVPGYVADPGAWLRLWIGVAAVAALPVGLETTVRYLRSDSALSRARTRLALAQFLPFLGTGAALTLVLARAAPGQTALLPGLWAVIFGLGVFASRPVLPRPLLVVGVWYVAAGLGVLLLARGEQALSPLAMGVPFGVGQGLAAVLLYLTLERRHGPTSRREA
jgi:hypothetical protein